MSLSHPPQLAQGWHAPESGYGCAMQLIAWERNDREVGTDLPSCVAYPLARVVQTINDELCEGGISVSQHVQALCPSCTRQVLALAHRAVGTGDLPARVTWEWIARLLTGKHGLVHRVQCRGVAGLLGYAGAYATAKARGGMLSEPRPDAACDDFCDHNNGGFRYRQLATRVLVEHATVHDWLGTVLPGFVGAVFETDPAIQLGRAHLALDILADVRSRELAHAR